MSAVPAPDFSDLILPMDAGDECIVDADAITRPSLLATPIVVAAPSLWRRLKARLAAWRLRKATVAFAKYRVVNAARAHYLAERAWLTSDGKSVDAEVKRLNWGRCQQTLDSRVAELIAAEEAAL